MENYDQYSFEICENQTIEIIRYSGSDEAVKIPGNIDGLPVTTIRKHAFAATNVAEVIIPEGVETIETEAFAICDHLQRVTLPASLKKLGQGVFKGSTELSQIVISEGNRHFSMYEGVLYCRDESALVFCPPGLKKETITVPIGVKIIASGAFFQNGHLKYVRLPISLEKIETEAFLFTPLMKMIELPPKLKEIAPDSFLLIQGPAAEKPFTIYAFPDSVGYKYAVENKIPVRPLFTIATDYT